ncbi:SufD family Fe-S cluster assembly protein [Candidatus Babeliales bacterium]|nr:SufD family Fe-S cluster assembly protein [Candidatus Babeliales bacterium]
MNHQENIIMHVAAHETKYWNLFDLDGQLFGSNMQIHFYLQQGSILRGNIALLNQSKFNLSLHVHLQGAGSQANIVGLYALRDRQSLNIATFQNHQTTATSSSIILRGLLHDQASVCVRGLVHIAHQAPKSKAGQENKNILLSHKASAVSIPSLEVLNHDVQCCHGTATSQFDKNHAWYLYARGLNHDQAYKHLMRSFLGEIVAHFDDPDFCMEKIWQKMT